MNAPEGGYNIGFHLPRRRLRVIVRDKYHLEYYAYSSHLLNITNACYIEYPYLMRMAVNIFFHLINYIKNKCIIEDSVTAFI